MFVIASADRISTLLFIALTFFVFTDCLVAIEASSRRCPNSDRCKRFRAKALVGFRV